MLNIKALVPNAKIIFIFREQIEIWRSGYQMHPYKRFSNGELSFWSFDDFIAMKIKGDKRQLQTDVLRYCDLFQKLTQLFGDKILFVEFKALFTDEKVQNVVADYIGVKSHEFSSLLRMRSNSHDQHSWRSRKIIIKTLIKSLLSSSYRAMAFGSGKTTIYDCVNYFFRQKVSLSAGRRAEVEKFYKGNTLIDLKRSKLTRVLFSR